MLSKTQIAFKLRGNVSLVSHSPGDMSGHPMFPETRPQCGFGGVPVPGVFVDVALRDTAR